MPLISTFGRQRQVELCQIETSLVCIASSRPNGLQGDPVSTAQNRQNKTFSAESILDTCHWNAKILYIFFRFLCVCVCVYWACMYVYVFVWVHICGWMCMHMSVYAHVYASMWQTEVNVRYLPRSLFTLFIEARFLAEPQAH